MITTKELKTLVDFESLQKGDTIACEFHRDMHDHPCVVALSINLKLTTTLDRAITQNPCYVPFLFGR